MTKTPIRVFSIVYGEDYIRRYCEFALPALLQPGNVPALMRDFDVRLCLYTTPDSMDTLQSSLAKRLYRHEYGKAIAPLVKIMAITIESDRSVDKNVAQARILANRQLQNACLFREISASVGLKALTLLCPADVFTGNGSLINLANAARDSKVCIASPYLKVDGDRFRKLIAAEKWPIENDRLVTLSIQSLLDYQRGTVRGGSRHLAYLLGADMLQVSPRLFGAIFCFPSVVISRFTSADLGFFRLQDDFRQWDMTWPAKLIAERRFLFLGSSDFAFQVELRQDSQAGVDAYLKMDDQFRRDIDPRDLQRYALHNEAMRNLAVTLRADQDVNLAPL